MCGDVCLSVCLYVHVCLCVSVCSCCKELELHSDMDVEVEIQFQMNRLIFSQMHYAIDQLDCIELLFPDYIKILGAAATSPTIAASRLPRSVLLVFTACALRS